jgi:hypothetical protein
MGWWLAVIVLYTPSIFIGALSRSAYWAAALGAVAMGAFVITLTMMADEGIAVSRTQVTVEFAARLGYGAIAGVVAFGLKRLIKTIWEKPGEIGAALAGFVMLLSVWAFYGVITAAYVYALWSDAREGKMGFFIIDLAIAPIGVIRGVLKYFGVI